MLGYVTVGVSDLDKAQQFYDALFAEVGAKQVMGLDRIKFYGTGEGPMVAICTPWDESQQDSGNGNMLAIAGGDIDGVSKLYNRAIELGATCDGEPGQRNSFFYGAYVRDADNNKICFYDMQN